ncbi:MAG: hypothetical protein HF300_11230 [Ignavibacteria bacterium]|nr:hypothetical protein [Ignavibacteria bacterium]MCU7500551.1 hypothetical protein [Ignavibacteria bacterium]MCU7513124.1 hypothetical protein [Ignavibacteria bacterium]MCU7521098.1 hypothetical protein [Ignavibacteria bacterium]MCU7524803.1 hypothetical protein [Ignavibacteria bacterium]
MKFMYLFLITAVLNSFLFANTESGKAENYPESPTKSYIYLSTGFYEAASVGLGHDFHGGWGAGIKTSVLLFKTDVLKNNGMGIGLEIHKRIFSEKKFRLFDTISFEASYGSTITTVHNPCSEIQLNVASQKESRDGIHLYYSIGLGYSYEKSSGGMFTPAFRLGTIYNF